MSAQVNQLADAVNQLQTQQQSFQQQLMSQWSQSVNAVIAAQIQNFQRNNSSQQQSSVPNML